MEVCEMVDKQNEDVEKQGYRVLLVDDDGVLLESLQRQLSERGYKVDIALSAASALRVARTKQYDAFVLDVTFGDGDGRDVCRQLREDGEFAPILLMTALESDEDELKGLSAGSNDYIRKPIRFDLLEARLRLHLRHQNHIVEETVKLNGDFLFMPQKKYLHYERADKGIKLTEKEATILNYLVKARGETVSREQFLVDVWSYQPDTNTHTLETHIYRLRRKIMTIGGDPNLFLRTDMGGYRLLF